MQSWGTRAPARGSKKAALRKLLNSRPFPKNMECNLWKYPWYQSEQKRCFRYMLRSWMSVLTSFPSASGAICNILPAKDPESFGGGKKTHWKIKKITELAKANKWTPSSATPHWKKRSDFWLAGGLVPVRAGPYDSKKRRGPRFCLIKELTYKPTLRQLSQSPRASAGRRY